MIHPPLVADERSVGRPMVPPVASCSCWRQAARQLARAPQARRALTNMGARAHAGAFPRARTRDEADPHGRDDEACQLAAPGPVPPARALAPRLSSLVSSRLPAWARRRKTSPFT